MFSFTLLQSSSPLSKPFLCAKIMKNTNHPFQQVLISKACFLTARIKHYLKDIKRNVLLAVEVLKASH
jgi:hypothetical protein